MKNVLFIILIFSADIALSQNPLLIPDTVSGSKIDLGLRNGSIEIINGFPTFTIGYNQDILGPTIILEKGQEINFNVTNYIDYSTTLHWHGLHVSSENDGGPHTVIEPGETWSPSFTVMDNASTYWYHPHLHEHTEEQVTRGAAGFIIVRDEEEGALTLPRTYGVDDFPMVIQSRAFDEDKQFVMGTAGDDKILVNATLDPFLDLPAQVIRLRLLNGSTERVYNLGFENNMNFYQITVDGGLLDSPVELTRLELAPGERAEILVNLSALEGNSIRMMSFASELQRGIYGASNPSAMGMGSISGYNQNPINGNDFEIIELRVEPPNDIGVYHIPNQLKQNIPFSTDHVDQTRNLTFRPKQMGPSGMLNGPFVINNVSYDMDVINFEIPLGNTEIWELTNMTAIAHPFHIHDVQFYILDINGSAPPASMQGRKDVVMVPPMGGTVRFITRFDDFANEEVPYMYHCHMLSHEDEGMMGQFIVKDNISVTKETEKENVLIFPNPTQDKISILGFENSIINLYSILGLLLETRFSTTKRESFDLSGYDPGIYVISIIQGDKKLTYHVIKS